MNNIIHVAVAELRLICLMTSCGDAKCQNLRVIRVRIHLVTSASSKPAAAAAATTLCAPVTRIRTVVLARTPAQVTPIVVVIVIIIIIEYFVMRLLHDENRCIPNVTYQAKSFDMHWKLRRIVSRFLNTAVSPLAPKVSCNKDQYAIKRTLADCWRSFDKYRVSLISVFEPILFGQFLTCCKFENVPYLQT